MLPLAQRIVMERDDHGDAVLEPSVQLEAARSGAANRWLEVVGKLRENH